MNPIALQHAPSPSPATEALPLFAVVRTLGFRFMSMWVRSILLVVSIPSLAQAQSPQPDRRSPALAPEPGTYVHGFATAAVGDSLRFNNPFRLAHQLGDSGQSLSRTPLYASLGGALTLGEPDGLQPGAAFHWSRALSGLPQHVVTPAFALLHGRWRPWLPFARAGLPIIVNPDPGVGGELSVGTAYLFTAGIGAHVELIGNVFYGAATWDSGVTTIPMLSLQAGLFVDYEVLP